MHFTHALSVAALFLAGCHLPPVALSTSHYVGDRYFLEGEHSVAFTFAEQGGVVEHIFERIRCKYEGTTWQEHRLVQQWRGDRKHDFERVLKSGDTLSYNLKSFCTAFETNYVFQFAIRRGQAETYIYPAGLKAYGVSVDSFAITKIEDAL